jgi:hypothetical protein
MDKKTILVVDDDDTICRKIVQIQQNLPVPDKDITVIPDKRNIANSDYSEHMGDGLDKLRSCMGVLGLDLDGIMDDFMPHHTIRPKQKCVLEECNNETQHNGGCCCAEHLYEVKKRQRALRK